MPQYPGLERYASGNPAGFPSQLPSAQLAPEAQLASQREVAGRREYLGRQAFEVQRQGMETLSSFRPGSAAALTSGAFQGMAQSLLAQRDIQAPDLMFRYHEERARQLREQERKRSRWGGIGAALGSIAGTIIAPGVGTALGGAIGGALGGEGSTMFARGGIVLPQPGGVQGRTPGGNKATFAEAGQPEVVVPLDKMGEVTQAYEQAQGSPNDQTDSPSSMSGAGERQTASGAPGPGSPPPLGREAPDAQRAGQPADQAAAQQAGMPQMGANAGFIGEAFQRAPDDPGADAYSTVGAAHFASQRLGVPADVLNAALTADEMEDDPTFMDVGTQLNHQLDYILDMDDMMSTGVI